MVQQTTVQGVEAIIVPPGLVENGGITLAGHVWEQVKVDKDLVGWLLGGEVGMCCRLLRSDAYVLTDEQFHRLQEVPPKRKPGCTLCHGMHASQLGQWRAQTLGGHVELPAAILGHSGYTQYQGIIITRF